LLLAPSPYSTLFRCVRGGPEVAHLSFRMHPGIGPASADHLHALAHQAFPRPLQLPLDGGAVTEALVLKTVVVGAVVRHRQLQVPHRAVLTPSRKPPAAQGRAGGTHDKSGGSSAALPSPVRSRPAKRPAPGGQTSSKMGMGAASPRRGPSLSSRV